ncbi:MAG: hypothetical protein ACK53L_21820, partial [Pirellulaceae bacterium]
MISRQRCSGLFRSEPLSQPLPQLLDILQRSVEFEDRIVGKPLQFDGGQAGLNRGTRLILGENLANDGSDLIGSQRAIDGEGHGSPTVEVDIENFPTA